LAVRGIHKETQAINILAERNGLDPAEVLRDSGGDMLVATRIVRALQSVRASLGFRIELGRGLLTFHPGDKRAMVKPGLARGLEEFYEHTSDSVPITATDQTGIAFASATAHTVCRAREMGIDLCGFRSQKGDSGLKRGCLCKSRNLALCRWLPGAWFATPLHIF
jgi:hypothetical protein